VLDGSSSRAERVNHFHFRDGLAIQSILNLDLNSEGLLAVLAVRDLHVLGHSTLAARLAPRARNGRQRQLHVLLNCHLQTYVVNGRGGLIREKYLYLVLLRVHWVPVHCALNFDASVFKYLNVTLLRLSKNIATWHSTRS